jgi:hypothetical protein
MARRVPTMAMDIAWIQWPAMAVTVGAAWLVASRQAKHRRWGFWAFLLSNGLWVAWGMDAGAWGLVVLQVCLAAMNLRGARQPAKKSADAS